MFPNKFLTAMAVPVILVAIACVLAIGGRADEKPAKAINGLSAQIVVTSKPLVRIENVQAALVLTNDGEKPVRLCTLCGGMRSGWAGGYEETFRPDFFKSGTPPAEDSAGQIVTLRPGRSISLPISPINTYGGIPREAEGKLKIAAAYEVGDEFAKKFDTWAGRVEAAPVVLAVAVGEPDEVGAWSAPVKGLQARLCVVRKAPFNGTPILGVSLELRNVSDLGAVMEVPWDEAKVRFTVTDAADKPVAAVSGPYDELTSPIGVLRLPHDSQLRFSASHNGAGVPKDQAAMLDSGSHHPVGVQTRGRAALSFAGQGDDPG